MSVKIARLEKRFESPGPQPNGLQAAEDALWCIDQVDNKVYKQDYETGKTLLEIQTDTVHSSGITLGGGSLWIASTYEVKIARLDPDTGEVVAKYDTPGAGVSSLLEGAENPVITGAHGLEWRDGRLYVATPPSQMVHVMDPDTWEEVHRFRTTGLRVHGLAWAANGRLWAADTSAGTVSLLDTGEGRVYDVIRVEAPDEVHGMTIRDGVLWYCDANTRDIGRLLVDA
jgi:outer membrane protein assembly factor BamB